MASEEEGVLKVRLAARGAARIAQNLRDDDEITVIPFDRDDVIATLEKVTTAGAGIPDILLDDTQVLLRPFLVEGPFVPRAAPGGQGRGSPLRGIAALPPLLGYVASTPKDRAQVLLWTPQDDPLLATWQYGLGHALAWTSDLKRQWGRDLVRWDGFPRLAAQLIGWLAPPPGSPRLSVQSRASGD